jgi:nitrite reductase/ring-hydroxylating ferredoxin subunit
MDPIEPDPGISRRTLLAAGSGTALGVAVLAACGGGGGSSAEPSPAPKPSAGGALARLADVPVGGAVSAQDASGKPVIVAQPTAGQVVAFSAICTHAGCTVAPQGKILQCPCHGSTYDLATGKNTGGPAPRPLPELTVKVRGGNVVET